MGNVRGGFFNCISMPPCNICRRGWARAAAAPRFSVANDTYISFKNKTARR
jgi:hypothetical protein